MTDRVFNAPAFLNLIRATEESDPAYFNMEKYASCSTPACIYGNYAARSDLQPILKLWASNSSYSLQPCSTVVMCSVFKREPQFVPHTHVLFLDFMGLSRAEAEELFSSSETEAVEVEDDEGDMVEEERIVAGTSGCGGAKTPAEAVAYLKTFYTRKTGISL